MPAQVFYPPAEPGQPVSFADWLPGDESLVAGWFVPAPAAWPCICGSRTLRNCRRSLLRGTLANTSPGWKHCTPRSPVRHARLLLWSTDGFIHAVRHRWPADRRRRRHSRRSERRVDLSQWRSHRRLFCRGRCCDLAASDLVIMTPINVANGFTAGSLTHLDWLDNNTLALYDENGLLQVTQRG